MTGNFLTQSEANAIARAEFEAMPGYSFICNDDNCEVWHPLTKAEFYLDGPHLECPDDYEHVRCLVDE